MGYLMLKPNLLKNSSVINSFDYMFFYIFFYSSKIFLFLPDDYLIKMALNQWSQKSNYAIKYI